MLPRQSHPSSRLLAQFPSPQSCRSGQEAVGLNILPSSDLAAAGMPSSQHGRLSTHRIQPCTGSSSVHAGPLTGYLCLLTHLPRQRHTCGCRGRWGRCTAPPSPPGSRQRQAGVRASRYCASMNGQRRRLPSSALPLDFCMPGQCSQALTSDMRCTMGRSLPASS